VNEDPAQRFALATYRDIDGDHVALVVDEGLIEVNQAVDVCLRLTAIEPPAYASLGSMIDLLEKWDTYFPILCEAAGIFSRGEHRGELVAPDEVYLLAPVTWPGKMLNVGLNFYDHAAEMGITIPSEGFVPNFFFKGDRNCIIGPSQTIRLSSPHVDWEAEVAVVIGRTARNVRAEDAMSHVAGYTCHNDVTDRRAMMKPDGGLDFFGGKSRDTFGPLGPYLVPREFVPDARNLGIRCYLNGQLMQHTNTGYMIWGPEQCIEYLSGIVTLRPGDVIALGTGAGVGWSKGINGEPRSLARIVAHMESGGGVYLRSGDCIAVDVDGVGRLENLVE
jgi:2,4-didehydro-3-deoxy-L-rhamnonate hydrolase